MSKIVRVTARAESVGTPTVRDLELRLTAHADLDDGRRISTAPDDIIVLTLPQRLSLGSYTAEVDDYAPTASDGTAWPAQMFETMVTREAVDLLPFLRDRLVNAGVPVTDETLGADRMQLELAENVRAALE